MKIDLSINSTSPFTRTSVATLLVPIFTGLNWYVKIVKKVFLRVLNFKFNQCFKNDGAILPISFVMSRYIVFWIGLPSKVYQVSHFKLYIFFRFVTRVPCSPKTVFIRFVASGCYAVFTFFDLLTYFLSFVTRIVKEYFFCPKS